LIDDRQGSNRFALRLYTVEKGGHTPLDQHPYEHQVYVLKGEGMLRQSTEPTVPLKTVRQGDSIFIPAGTPHWYKNAGKESAEFLCIVPKTEKYDSVYEE
jgi:quercetin dioxygenase-like cupin family protein